MRALMILHTLVVRPLPSPPPQGFRFVLTLGGTAACPALLVLVLSDTLWRSKPVDVSYASIETFPNKQTAIPPR